jgi:hypothetical protein
MGVYGHNAPRLTVTMKDLDVLERFQKIVGVGTLLPHANPQRDQWVWRTNNRADSRTALLMLLPYFGVRRTRKALELIDNLFAEIAERDCERCGRPFTPKRGMQGHQRFCSYKCRRAAEWLRSGKPRKLEKRAQRSSTS